MTSSKNSVCSGGRRFCRLPCRPILPASRTLALLRLGGLAAGLALAFLLAEARHVRDDPGHAPDSLGTAFAKDQPLADLKILWMLHEPVKTRKYFMQQAPGKPEVLRYKSELKNR